MVHSDHHVLEKNGRLFEAHFRSIRTKHETDRPSPKDILEFNYRISPCTLCCRRNFMGKVICDDPTSFNGTFMMADIQLFVGMASVAPVKFLDWSLSTYRRHTASMTGSPEYRNQALLYRSNEEMCRHLISRYCIADEEGKAIVRRFELSRLGLAYWARDKETVMEVVRIMQQEGNSLNFRSWVYYWALREPLLDAFIRQVLPPLRKLLRSG